MCTYCIYSISLRLKSLRKHWGGELALSCFVFASNVSSIGIMQYCIVQHSHGILQIWRLLKGVIAKNKYRNLLVFESEFWSNIHGWQQFFHFWCDIQKLNFHNSVLKVLLASSPQLRWICSKHGAGYHNANHDISNQQAGLYLLLQIITYICLCMMENIHSQCSAFKNTQTNSLLVLIKLGSIQGGDPRSHCPSHSILSS